MRMERTADDLAAAIRAQSEAVLALRPDAKNWAARGSSAISATPRRCS